MAARRTSAASRLAPWAVPEHSPHLVRTGRHSHPAAEALTRSRPPRLLPATGELLSRRRHAGRARQWSACDREPCCTRDEGRPRRGVPGFVRRAAITNSINSAKSKSKFTRWDAQRRNPVERFGVSQVSRDSFAHASAVVQWCKSPDQQPSHRKPWRLERIPSGHGLAVRIVDTTMRHRHRRGRTAAPAHAARESQFTRDLRIHRESVQQPQGDPDQLFLAAQRKAGLRRNRFWYCAAIDRRFGCAWNKCCTQGIVAPPSPRSRL